MFIVLKCLKIYDLLDVLNKDERCYIFIIWIDKMFFVIVDE